jgi:hypothetical protein
MVRNDLKKEDIQLLWLKGKVPIVAARQLGVQVPTGSLLLMLLMLCEDSKLLWWLALRLAARVINTK